MSSPPERITLKTLFRDFLLDFSEVDRGLLGTIINLTLRPARVVDTFLFTHRDRFVRPTRYLVFCFSLAALQVFTIQAWYGASIKELNAAVESASPVSPTPPVAGEHVKDQIVPLGSRPSIQGFNSSSRLDQLAAQARQFVDRFQTFAFLLALPLLALVYYYLYARHGYNLAESITAATYLHAHTTLLGIVFLPFYFLGDTPADYERWSSVEDRATGIYLLFAVTCVFARRWWETLVAVSWACVVIFFLGLAATSLVFVSGALARILLEPGDPATLHLSGRFILGLIQVVLILPTVILLLYRLHPLRGRPNKRTTKWQWLLLFGLFVFLFLANFDFNQLTQ